MTAGEGPRGWAAPLHTRVLDLAGVGAGTRVLDLGCGTGGFAAAAVARGARVLGLDLDPVAVERAAAAVPGARFAVGDATELGDPGPHDVAAAVQLLPHVAAPGRVLAGAGRVAPVVVATVWGREDECGVRAFGEALEGFLGPRRPAPALDAAALRALAVDAGLAVAALEEVVCPFVYDDEDDVLAPLFSSGIGHAAMRAAGPVAVRDAVLGRMERHRRPDGSYVLENLFRVLLLSR
ncbi:MAG: methyltransferase domain-containing protein [Pseudonocardiales bacterium]|jgi:SAM-dependent methyltransferase|nr:methyltransferase domain-containing protein [Pseudonocardiales bacterium]